MKVLISVTAREMVAEIGLGLLPCSGDLRVSINLKFTGPI